MHNSENTADPTHALANGLSVSQEGPVTVRRELPPSVEIVKVPGTHKDFVFTSRKQMVSTMQRFLGGKEKGL